MRNLILEITEATNEYRKFTSSLAYALNSQIIEASKNQGFLSALGDGQIQAAMRHLKPIFFYLEKERVLSFYRWAAKVGVLNALVKMKKVMRQEGFVPSEVVQTLETRYDFLLKFMEESTARELGRFLSKKFEENKGMYEIVEEIVVKFPSLNRNRAEVIALTETNFAVNAGEYGQFKQFGVTRTIWRTVKDKRVCPLCQALDGTETGIDELYSSDYVDEKGRNWLEIPGNFAKDVGGIKHPPLHCRCRCLLEPK